MKCPYCGAPLEESEKRCEYCGSVNEKYKEPVFGKDSVKQASEQKLIAEKQKKALKKVRIIRGVVVAVWLLAVVAATITTVIIFNKSKIW